MSKIVRIKNDDDSSVPIDSDLFYRELTSRNFHFIHPETQSALREMRVLIAGCGSTGGACIESLARVGVTHFILTDNGSYDLSNLNRQHARLDSMGKNKALFHQEELRAINPFIHSSVDIRGVQDFNVKELCEGVDLVFDALDVTTSSGMRSKIALHVQAKELKLPVLCALDLGFCQWGTSYDYRNPDVSVLKGRLSAALRAQNPIKALFEIYPLRAVPDHCLILILDLLEERTSFASQLGCTSDLLSAIIVPIILGWLQSGKLVKGWSYDTYSLARSRRPSLLEKIEFFRLRKRIKEKLSQTV